MAWSKDNSRAAKLAAEEALEQAQRAETGADYIAEVTPKIDEFVGEQTNLQTQLNDLVLQSGTDVAEVVQARGGEVTLNARLNKTTAQLADKVEQQDINVAVAPKADKEYTDTQLSLKRDKGTLIKNTDLDTSADSNKIKLVNLADEVQRALTGNAPALTTLPDGIVVKEKIADGAVTELKIGTGQVTGRHLENGTVGEIKLSSNAVSTIKLVNLAVTKEKIADGAASTHKLSPLVSGFNDYRTNVYYELGKPKTIDVVDTNGVLSSTSLNFSADGILQSVSETVEGKKVTTTLTYNTDGSLKSTENLTGVI